MWNTIPTLGKICWGRRLMPAAAALGLGLVLVLEFARPASAQNAGAQNPLTFGNIYPVTGDYVVAGAYGMDTNIANGFATGIINIPDANPATGKPNPGITGRMAVPAGADIVLAELYWQTVEKLDPLAGNSGTGQNGTFRPLFTPLGQKQPRYPISGVNLMPQTTVSFSNGGCTGGSTGKVVRTYRADVRGYLPQVQGKVSANGRYEVRLPSSSSTTPITLGATLVIIYRVLDDKTVPPNMIIINDGSFAPGNTLLNMTQTIGPFYDATHDDKVRVSRVTQIVGSGHSNKFETAFLNGVPLPSLYASGQPFPGYYGGFDNTTWTFDANRTYVNLTNPVNGGDSFATSMVMPATSQQGCVSWGAIIFSTTYQESDGDGLADAWKAPPISANNPHGVPGYCDASVNGGVCMAGSPSWVDLPGAKAGQRDVFMQLHYMCSTTDGSTCDGRYSFDPRLAVDLADGRNAVQKVVDSFADVDATGNRLHLHQPINLHVIIGNAIPEPTCSDANNNNVLCGFPNQPGAVAWPGGILFLQNQLVDPLGNACTIPIAANCGPRVQQAKNISYHFGVSAHSLGLPQWTLGDGTLTSVVQVDRNTVQFTTSTPHGLTNDPVCANGNNGLGRVTVAFAISNANLNETFCVTVTGPTTFTIQAAGSANFNYTSATDPNLVVAPGQTGTISGFSDKGGQHSLFTLGNWGDDGKSWQVIAGTLQHEIGHELGLGHGGGDDINCKSNYQSVMSYSRQVDLLDKFTGFDQNGNPLLTQVVDYSGQVLDTLNEGVSGSNPFTIVPTYYTANWYLPTVVGSPATQHCNGTPITDGARMSRVTDVTSALNWVMDQDINFDGNNNELLHGFDDWNSGLNLPQGPATGVFSSAGGVGAVGGLGGVGIIGGSGGVGIVGGSGGVGAIGGLGGVGITGGNGGVGAVGGLGGVGAVGGNGGVGITGGNGGVPELTRGAANSVTRVPQRLSATEGVSPRTITLHWFRPNFGQIGAYNVYRSESGGAFTFLKTVPVVNNPQEITTTDMVTCDPGGFRYQVSALLAPDNTQESQRSNIAPLTTPPLLTGCYTNNPPSVALTDLSFPANPNVHGSLIPITWTLQVDNPSSYPNQSPFVNNLAANTLDAIGPLQPSAGGACPTSAPTGPVIHLLSKGNVINPPNSASTYGVSTGPNYQFTFTLDTDVLSSGCYFLKLTTDSGQSETTTSALQLQIDVNDTDSTPHVATLALTAGTVGVAYSNQLTQHGGTAPFSWTFTGSLPPTITLNPVSGLLSGTTCAAGNYNFTAMVTDSKSNSGTQPLTLQINKANTTTGVLSNANPSVFQQMVTFTVTVAPQYTCTPTGTVTLFDGVNQIGSNSLSGGMATFTTSALSVGMHNITASYGGDASFNASNSATLVQTVNKANTTITINSVLPSPAVVGQAITVAYTLTVVPPGAGTPIGPTGTVMVAASDGSGCSVPAALGPGMCALSPAPTTAGNITFTVTYSGDSNFVGSGANGNYTVLIFVSDTAPPPFTATKTLPNGVVGSPYSNTVYESGGVTTGPNNFSWTIVPNSVMPGGGSTLPGLSFQPNTAGVTNGTLSGTPTSAGTFTFTAMVTDSAGNTGTQNLTITLLAPAPAPFGLVSWYPFEGNANDLEKINNGNVVGTPQFVPGEVDNGFKPGPQLSNSLITVPDSPTLALPQFTIGAWVRVDALDNVETMQVVWKGDNTGGDLTTPYSLSVLGSAPSNFGSGTLVGTAGPGKVLVILTDGTHELDLVSTNALPRDGKFHYVAVTADGQKVNLYIDGALDGNSPASESSLTGLPFTSTNPLQIGGIQGGPAPGNNFDGVIDELQIWNRVLTPAEVSGIFNAIGEYQPAARPAGLVSWWPAEGNYTDIISGNNGTPAGGTGFAPGEVGQAFQFDGATGVLAAPNTAAIDITGDLTIEAWVNPASATRGEIVFKGSGIDYTAAYELRYGNGNDQSLLFGVADGSSGTMASYFQTASGVVPVGVFSHVAVTVSGTTATIYVNGLPVQGAYFEGVNFVVSPANQLTANRFSDHGPLRIGNGPAPDNNIPFSGVIDEVSIYNRALTSTEIQSIVNAGGAGKAKP